MLARRLACTSPRLNAPHFFKNSSACVKARRSSSWTGTNPTHLAGQPPASAPVQAVITELDKLCPRIDIDAAEIQVLREPKDFFNTLKGKIQNAERRIYLATLYVGRSEHELIEVLRQRLHEKSELKVSILTDALRGTRETPDPSCASLLSSLAAEFPSQVEIRMYHTPNLTGLRKSLVPKRLNEGWGLQHMKLYGIDDEIILSGANLSSDYFTNRQDRYHLFSSKEITEYFAQVHHSMCRMSFILRPEKDQSSYKLEWPQDNACDSPINEPAAFIETSKTLFEPLTRPRESPKPPPGPGTASVFPVLIIPQAINTELPAMGAILDASTRKVAACMFTAGYFNPDPKITSAILDAARAGSATTVVTASPWANGFYGSKGVSGLLPPAYTLLARRFIQAAEKAAPGVVQLREWRLGTVGRPHGWTYHAKGLWLSFVSPDSKPTPENDMRGQEPPSVTIIGSSNYTVRSYSLDTEAGAIVVTDNQDLKQRLQSEKANLLEHSRVVTEEDLSKGERKVGPVVRIAMWVVRVIGGSL